MAYDGNRLLPFEWIGSIVWAIFFGVLGYIAITEKSISLAGKMGVGHFTGFSAIVMGFLLFGASIAGLSQLLRLHPFKRLLRVLLFAGWSCSVIIYFLFCSP